MPPATIMGPMASPSRPSVMFTPLLAPIMTSMAKPMYQRPRSGLNDLKKGTARLVEYSGSDTRATAATPATINWPRILARAERPLFFFLTTLR